MDQQAFVQNLNNVAAVYNDDFIGIASYNIFVGIAVATIFGAAFFFDLFWPERHESRSVRLAWKISAVAITVMCIADAIALTVWPASLPSRNKKESLILTRVSNNLGYRCHTACLCFRG